MKNQLSQRFKMKLRNEIMKKDNDSEKIKINLEKVSSFPLRFEEKKTKDFQI